MSFLSLIARDLVKVYGDRRVLDGVDLVAGPGQRIGLVGENGAGKSTLLRLLAGTDEPHAGTVLRPAAVGLLDQELPYRPEVTLAAVVEDALAVPRAAEAWLAAAAESVSRGGADPDRLAGYAAALAEAEAVEAWDADRRADVVFAGLGLSGLDRDRPVGTLSGGERSRVGLAALLIRRPRALLLDEPTNHLDDEALDFVEEQVRGLPGVVVVASHDRVFLDRVCTDIVDLDPTRTGPTRYGGAYSAYLASKRAERRRWEERFAAEQEELAELRRSVAVTAPAVAPGRGPRDKDKMQYNFHGIRVEKQVSRRVRNARRRLDELERTQVRKPPAPLEFRAVLGRPAGGDGPLLAVRDLVVPGRLALDRLDVTATDRLLVTGPNGAGKSTLLAVLAGLLDPAAGSVRRLPGLRVGLLAQDVVFGDPTRTARSYYAIAVGPEGPEPASLGLLAPRDLDRPVGELSVGQRRRLGLALLVGRAPHLLLLDEPTNHLSPALAEELEDALGTAPGAVVAATHDRWLRRRWTGREVAVRR